MRCRSHTECGGDGRCARCHLPSAARSPKRSPKSEPNKNERVNGSPGSTNLSPCSCTVPPAAASPSRRKRTLLQRKEPPSATQGQGRPGPLHHEGAEGHPL